MKKAVWFSAMGVLAATGTIARAEEIGRVLESSPVIQQVQVPRQVCSNQVVGGQPNTGAGAVIGGLAGGALGNAVSSGSGGGRAAATVLGVIGGALLGNSVQNSNNQPRNIQRCTTQTFLENRTVAYNVRYEYAGREYSVQMPYDPGPTIRLQVTPVADNGPAAGQSQQGGVIIAPPVQGNGNTPIPSAYPSNTQAQPAYPQAYPANQGQQVYPANPQGQPVPLSEYQNNTPTYLQSPDGYPPSGVATSTSYDPTYPYYPSYGYPYYSYPYSGYDNGYGNSYGYPYFPVALSLGFGYWGWGGGHYGGHGWAYGSHGGSYGGHGGYGGGGGHGGRGGGGRR